MDMPVHESTTFKIYKCQESDLIRIFILVQTPISIVRYIVIVEIFIDLILYTVLFFKVLQQND